MIYTSPSSILPCEDCDLSNIILQDLLKLTSSPSMKLGERIYIYTSWVNWKIYGGKKFLNSQWNIWYDLEYFWKEQVRPKRWSSPSNKTHPVETYNLLHKMWKLRVK